MRHRAAAEMVGCRYAPEPPFPCLVRRSFNEGGPPILFKPFYVRFSFLRTQKEKAGQKFGKEQGYMVDAKSVPQKGGTGWQRNGTYRTYKTYRSRDWAFCQPCSPELPQPMALAQPCSPPCIHSIPSIPSRGCPHLVHCARLRESSAVASKVLCLPSFSIFACKKEKSGVHYLR